MIRIVRFTTLLISLFALLGVAGLAFANRATVDVDVSNFLFNPADVEIGVGDTVRWTNSAGFHSVQSTGGPEAFGRAAGSGWEYEFTFNSAGEYTYICSVHPGSMQGTVTVTTPSSVGLGRVEAVAGYLPATVALLLLLLLSAALPIVQRRRVR